MDLTVVVINYNTKDQLRRCLDSMPDRVRGEPLRVMVIDNASPDGSASTVALQYRGRVELAANRANVGFARAVNQALELTSTRYVLVLNADIVVQPGAIEALYDFMEKTPDAGLAGGQLADETGQIQPSCRRFYTASAILLRRTPLGRLMPRHRAIGDHLMADWDHQEVRTVDWLQGACLMIRREAVEAVGAMDERFFLYFEDVDLARRMAAGGWGVYYVPGARFVHHYRRGSRGLLSVEAMHHLQSALRYLGKWNSRAWLLLEGLRQGTILLLMLLDLLIINGGFVLCLALRNRLGGQLPGPATMLSTYYPILAGANLLLLAAFASTGLYRLERSTDWLGSVAQAVRAITWVALAGSVFLFFAPSYRSGFIYSRMLLLLYFVVLILLVCLCRLAIKSTVYRLWRKHLLLRRILVVGEAYPTKLLADAIRAEPTSGYEVAAILPLPEGNGEDLDGAFTDRFQNMVRDERPGGVVFVAHRRSFRSYVPLVLESLERNLEVRVATSPDLFPYLAVRYSEICGQPAADVTRTPFYRLKRFLKRSVDFTFAFVGLVLSAPLILVLAPLIRMHDGGPVFYLQQRVGKHGRPFKIIKLRTMKVDAEVDQRANIAEGPLTLILNDPRVTPLGRWLRYHKLDELPQLFNVALGQMSIVGPRPPIAEEVAEYTEWQKGRLFVRPGITGLWQIDKERKWRFNEMVELDLQYILNWSLLLDYSVMMRTVQVVLRGS